MPRQETRVTVEGRELTISNLDKVLFPETGFTKGQLIDYYATVATAMLPHVADRPLTMKRYPDGVDGKFFYEKHIPSHAPDWVRSVEVPTAEGEGEVSMVLLLHNGSEVEVKLPGRFKVSPQIAGAIKAVTGVVTVEAL